MPVDPAAEERAWAVVSRAYRDRVAVPRPRRRWPIVAVAAAVVVVAAALSPPGRAVVDAVRRSVGVSHASPALFRLPARRAAARERRRRDLGRVVGRLAAPSRVVAAGGLVAARAFRRRCERQRACGGRSVERRRAVVARPAGHLVARVGRDEDGHPDPVLRPRASPDRRRVTGAAIGRWLPRSPHSSRGGRSGWSSRKSAGSAASPPWEPGRSTCERHGVTRRTRALLHGRPTAESSPSRRRGTWFSIEAGRTACWTFQAFAHWRTRGTAGSPWSMVVRLRSSRAVDARKLFTSAGRLDGPRVVA